MKIPRSLYTILQYISTHDDIFAYLGNGYLVVKDKVGSGFVEVKAPDYFFKEPLVVSSLSKFLRLFTYDKKDKATDPLSIQDWTLGKSYNSDNASISEMYIKSPGRNIKLKQGSPRFLDNRSKDLVSKVDSITFEKSIKFQLTTAQYKQILSDCSLLDLDTITFISDNNDLIKINLTKNGKGMSDDYSSFDIECHHEHFDARISIQLSQFSLIDATDHQFEFGQYLNKFGSYSNVLKVKSFCDNKFIVNKVILGK